MAIAVGIIGGSGYTAAELLRLLVNHPNVEIRAISSRTEKGQEISRLFPNLAKHISLKFLDPEDPAFLIVKCFSFARHMAWRCRMHRDFWKKASR